MEAPSVSDLFDPSARGRTGAGRGVPGRGAAPPPPARPHRAASPDRRVGIGAPEAFGRAVDGDPSGAGRDGIPLRPTKIEV